MLKLYKATLLLISFIFLSGCFSYNVVRDDDTQIIEETFYDEKSALEYIDTYKEFHDYKLIKSLIWNS
jgi:hypothetical protein